ncbi:hypothetical protein ACH3XW_27390 [Acanthocheilonema viteae]|uniref:Spaetzle domain-containing protein n=1 Tax=Acanthocheilonema viteae TaxID=6277 RepID=A0A498S6T4_ACAVI|nr:unnamed protein product [Acanthocheilonema viteae]
MHCLADFRKGTNQANLETAPANTINSLIYEKLFSIDENLLNQNISKECAEQLHKIVQNPHIKVIPTRLLLQHLKSCHPLNQNPRRKRMINQQLCETERVIVHMNDENQEFIPPFYTEVYCKVRREQGKKTEQMCANGQLRCVQIFGEVNFVRRQKGDVGFKPYKIHNVPRSCDCMWQADIFGEHNYED